MSGEAVFVTALGCTITVGPAPEHLGPGRMLVASMRQPGDGRWFEVYLDPFSLRTLREALSERGME